jgi:hypothetical protein
MNFINIEPPKNKYVSIYGYKCQMGSLIQCRLFDILKKFSYLFINYNWYLNQWIGLCMDFFMSMNRTLNGIMDRIFYGLNL